ncbi:DUF192 domain-containing protein [Pelistega europaea]|uniref:DUF192 domain-containing protein n=1 Tax=Pelistega europaea TaxID=106147 RepID=A0A7Y4P5H7_9BURK|nr:DUF192 domain-containing protein [Pelistega europaea]NOL48869.1 DUF192 domain-containing protein [Pelistega europaea]
MMTEDEYLLFIRYLTFYMQRLCIATTFKQRFVGLMGLHSLTVDKGLYLPHCKAVHTFFMRIPIRVIFFDKQGQVVRDIPQLQPWSWAYCREADSVLECSVNSLFTLKNFK